MSLVGSGEEAWRKVHLAHIAERQVALWLHCRRCHHNAYPNALAFGTEHGLPETTPLHLIEPRLVCTVCGARDGHCWPAPPKGGVL